MNRRLSGIFDVLHFYLALFAGWAIYHQDILPASLARKFMEPMNYDEIRLYLLHILAFSSLAYIVIRPFMHLLSEVTSAIVNKIHGFFE